MVSENFNFPFEPYAIQREFMTSLYEAVDQGKIGIFESPTGTGKSLSLICGSLTWLREHKHKAFDASLAVENAEDEPDWVVENVKQERRRIAVRAREAREQRLAKARQRETKLLEKYNKGEPAAKRRRVEGGEDVEVENFLLDDYDSDAESTVRFAKESARSGLSVETLQLLDKIEGKHAKEEPKAEEAEGPVIYYCSRTHSQLSQFASELRKVSLPPVIDPDPQQTDSIFEQLRHLTLGSRKNLCINPKVSKLGSSVAINEKCLDLQKPGTAADKKCQFVPSKEDEAVVNKFRDYTMATIRDIEDMGQLGKSMNICPYYASRSSVPASEIITLPYPLLLQKSAREALGISLKDNVVVIDEAHNLMDSICGIHSSSISLTQLQRGKDQLITYLQKFRTKLKGKNRVYVAQTVRVLDSLIIYLLARQADKTVDGLAKLSELLAGKGVDQIDMFKLNIYLQESRLARKVDGYTSHVAQACKPPSALSDQPRTTIPVLMQFQSFMVTLMNPSAEGRFFFALEDGDMHLRYLLLDPTHHFRSIVDEARAVILAGGTMSPMDDYLSHLFAYVDPARISTLSLGHIVPATSLAVFPATTTHTGADFDFTFGKRDSKEMIVAAGELLLQSVKVIPDGVVAFFPSYAYLDKCITTWKSARSPSMPNTTLWAAISAIKPIFHESKPSTASTANNPPRPPPTTTTTTETLLTQFTTAVHSPPTPHAGALLLAIISGSLSEGINFSDALGRAVLVFGLPFPNPHSAEWRARMEYISARARAGEAKAAAAAAAAASTKSTAAATATATAAAKKAAQSTTATSQQHHPLATQFYTNATMRAVNQAVGRAIRHAGDYAVVVLVDRRYGTGRVQGKLPAWMRGSLRGGGAGSAGGVGVGHVVSGCREFFRGRT